MEVLLLLEAPSYPVRSCLDFLFPLYLPTYRDTETLMLRDVFGETFLFFTSSLPSSCAFS